LKVLRDGRPITVEVSADGAGLVSHAGSVLLAQVADKLGLTRALSLRLAALKQRRRGHDPGRVIRDLAVMLADGGECVSDLGAVRDQGGFNWSSQHLDRGGVDGQANGVDEGTDRSVADEVTGGAVASAGGRARVLA
jgi:hypothetical protein